MIRCLTEFFPYRDYINSIQSDRELADTKNETAEEILAELKKASARPDHLMLGVFRDEALLGIFEVLVLPEDRYLELLLGLSAEREAYEALLDHLQKQYPGFQADFVFSPLHRFWKSVLTRRRVEFETEQQKMLFSHCSIDVDTSGVELLSPETRDQYLLIHNRDLYWTGERVIRAPERFRSFVAVEDGKVVGYLDVTCCFEENEPYDLLVKEEHRGRGFGRKLLARALRMNEPKEMMLFVDVDNYPAIRLYESLGFIRAEGKNLTTAHWMIPSERGRAEQPDS